METEQLVLDKNLVPDADKDPIERNMMLVGGVLLFIVGVVFVTSLGGEPSKFKTLDKLENQSMVTPKEEVAGTNTFGVAAPPPHQPTTKPTETPVPTQAANASPTSTPIPTASPSTGSGSNPTATPEPTATPTVTPTQTPSPTLTPEPTQG